jgi:hypothetical protein
MNYYWMELLSVKYKCSVSGTSNIRCTSSHVRYMCKLWYQWECPTVPFLISYSMRCEDPSHVRYSPNSRYLIAWKIKIRPGADRAAPSALSVEQKCGIPHATYSLRNIMQHSMVIFHTHDSLYIPV